MYQPIKKLTTVHAQQKHRAQLENFFISGEDPNQKLAHFHLVLKLADDECVKFSTRLGTALMPYLQKHSFCVS